MISLILPSRSRPGRAIAVARDWIAKAGDDVELIVSLDEDDPKLDGYLPVMELGDMLVAKNHNAVEAINRAATIAKGDIIVVASDDFECPDQWVRRIEKATFARHDWLLKTYDRIQNYIVTLPIMDREYYNRFGYIYNPVYEHMFCDTELTHVADILGRLLIRNDITFRHNHYSTQKDRSKDAVTLKADQTFDRGAMAYLKRVREKFGLLNVDVKALSNEGRDHLKWLKQHGV